MMATLEPRCSHCNEPCDEKTVSHWTEGPRGDGNGHAGLCCDCMDLRHGMPLSAVNAARARNGKAPIAKPWPGRGQ